MQASSTLIFFGIVLVLAGIVIFCFFVIASAIIKFLKYLIRGLFPNQKAPQFIKEEEYKKQAMENDPLVKQNLVHPRAQVFETPIAPAPTSNLENKEVQEEFVKDFHKSYVKTPLQPSMQVPYVERGVYSQASVPQASQAMPQKHEPPKVAKPEQEVDTSIYQGKKDLSRRNLAWNLKSVRGKTAQDMLNLQKKLGLNLSREERAGLINKYMPGYYGINVSKEELRKQLNIVERQQTRSPSERLQRNREIAFLRKVSGIKK